MLAGQIKTQSVSPSSHNKIALKKVFDMRVYIIHIYIYMQTNMLKGNVDLS